MPTRWNRIPVTEDPELADALARVEPFFPDVSPARLVHDLAVKGAEAVAKEQATADEAIERLIELSTTDAGFIAPDMLEEIDRAWGP